MVLTFFAATDPGKRYNHNEDYCITPNLRSKSLSTDILQLFVMCDGMGGTNAGEVASRLTAEWLYEGFLALVNNNVAFSNGLADHETIANAMNRLIIDINGRIIDYAASDEQFYGMGTTLLAAIFFDRTLHLHSIGDSRCYRLQHGILEQLTEDQSAVWKLYQRGDITKEELRLHPQNNLLTMAIGAKTDLTINSYRNICEIDDLFLLCSDGLSDMLSDTQIDDILQEEDSLEDTARRLITEALKAGGTDNISVILIKVIG
jgi:PPM family protein phosphatase